MHSPNQRILGRPSLEEEERLTERHVDKKFACEHYPVLANSA